MPDITDRDLIREYARVRSEAAFAEIVRRYVNLVYSVAFRFTGNAGDAQDVTQAVFLILAQKAGTLGHVSGLSSWLYETTRFTATRFLRAQIRRHHREQEAYMQSSLNESDPPGVWEQLAPELEAAMARLSGPDRALMVLRYYENKTGAEAAALLGIGEAAAHKRTARALEKLRAFFQHRGLKLTTAALAAALAAHSVSAAPAGLGATIVAATASGAAASTSTLTLIQGALKIMAWTKAKIAIVSAAAVLAVAGTTTVVIRTGVLDRNGSGPLLEQSASWKKVFSNGINNAHNLPDAIYTYPEGDEKTHAYVEQMIRQFRRDLDPAQAVKSDRELTEQDIHDRTIYIYGSPENHSLFRRVREDLPLVFEADGIRVGKQKCLGRDVGAIFVCPNPINPKNRLVVYGTVAPETLRNMNSIYHGPTDFIVFNNLTRRFTQLPDSNRFLLVGAFDKSDPEHWRVDENLEATPPKPLQRLVAQTVMAR